MSDESDRWELVTEKNEFIKRDIDAFIAVRVDIVHILSFWCNHMGFCPKEDAEKLNAKLDGLYETLMKVQMEKLVRSRQGPDGWFQYIKKDYFEDEGNKLSRENVEDNFREVWRAMREIDEEVEKTWNMPEQVQKKYETVKQKAFSSIRARLKIPSFKDLRHREERERYGRSKHVRLLPFNVSDQISNTRERARASLENLLAKLVS